MSYFAQTRLKNQMIQGAPINTKNHHFRLTLMTISQNFPLNRKKRHSPFLVVFFLVLSLLIPGSCRNGTIVDTPTILGQSQTTDPRPIWTWTGPEDAVGYLARIAELESEEQAHLLAANVVSYQPTTPLGAGTYTFGLKTVGPGSLGNSLEAQFSTTIVTPQIANAVEQVKFEASFGNFDAFSPGAGGVIGIEYTVDDVRAMLIGFLFRDVVMDTVEFRFGKNDISETWLFVIRNAGCYTIFQITEADYHTINARDPYYLISH